MAQPAYGWCPPTLQIGGKDYREKVAVEPLKAFKEANPDAKALLIEGLKEIGADPDPAKMHLLTYNQEQMLKIEKLQSTINKCTRKI